MVGIDRQLQVGQAVSIQDTTTGYQITILPPEQSGPRIVEVGPDYVVIDQPDAGVRTRIPAHLLLALTPAGTSVPTATPEVPQAA